ncbi:MAG TPA: TolC family protein [bacterium]|nr:TolC family protein [bacterium]
MKIPLIFSFLAALGLAGLSAAPAGAETLTWKQCVEEAARVNPELNSSRERVSSSRYLTKSARSNFFPQVAGNLGYSNSDSFNAAGTIVPTGSTFTTGNNRSTFSSSLQASQNIFNGFADKARVNQAKANEGIASAALEGTAAKISFDLKSAFAGLQFAQSSQKLAREIIKRRKDNKDMVELRFDSGQENKGSLLLSQANLKDAEFGSLQAKDDVKTAQHQLAKALGRDSGDGLHVAGGIPLTSPKPPADLDAMMRDTPDYRDAVSRKKFAKETITAARSAFFPALNVNAAVGTQDDSFFPTEGAWSVGANLSIPIFNGGRDFYNVKSAKALDAAARFNQTDTETAVRSALVQAYTAYEESVERLKTDQSFLEAATVRADIARAQYNNGLLSFQDWDIIENDLINREKAVLQSRRDRIIAEAAWEQAQGKGVLP